MIVASAVVEQADLRHHQLWTQLLSNPASLIFELLGISLTEEWGAWVPLLWIEFVFRLTHAGVKPPLHHVWSGSPSHP
jgi:hypothetical protein